MFIRNDNFFFLISIYLFCCNSDQNNQRDLYVICSEQTYISAFNKKKKIYINVISFFFYFLFDAVGGARVFNTKNVCQKKSFYPDSSII